MPAILLKAQTGTTKSRREGNKTIVEKTVEGVLTETHTDTTQRLRGKQSANKSVTLSAADLKAFDKVNDEKVAKGLGAGKAATARQLASMNEAANKAVGQVRAELKLANAKLARTEVELALTKPELARAVAAAHEKLLARQRGEAEVRAKAKEKRAAAKERAAKRGKQ